MDRRKACQILGISDNADKEAIQKAYKKMAMKCHPDRPTGSTEKFQELQKAYECVLKPDDGGMGDIPGMNAAFNFKMNGVPFSMFDTMFRQAAGGGNSNFNVKMQRQSNAFVFTQTTQTFPLVNVLRGQVMYKGIQVPNWVKAGDVLKVNKTERLQVQIAWPPGVTQHKSGRNNILIQKKIGLDKALLGREFRIMHPDGSPLMVTTRDLVIQPMKEYKISNHGLPSRSGMKGDLFVKFHLELPDSVSDEVRQQLLKLYPQERLARVHHDVDVVLEE